jgi:hypothetical protein
MAPTLFPRIEASESVRHTLRRPNQMLVKFAPGTNDGKKAQAVGRAGVTLGSVVSAAQDGDWVMAHVPPGLLRGAGPSSSGGQDQGLPNNSRSVLAGLAALIAEDSSVQFVEPNFVYTTQQVPSTPNDAYFTHINMWGMKDGSGGSNATGAWKTQTSCSKIAVGIIDEVRHDATLLCSLWSHLALPASHHLYMQRTLGPLPTGYHGDPH